MEWKRNCADWMDEKRSRMETKDLAFGFEQIKRPYVIRNMFGVFRLFSAVWRTRSKSRGEKML